MSQSISEPIPSSAQVDYDDPPVPPIFHVLLHNPELLQQHLRMLHEQGFTTGVPNLWQVYQHWALSVARAFKRGKVPGMDPDAPVRDTPGAQLLQFPAIRFWGLLFEGAINPWDYTGLALTPQRKMKHVMGAYHFDHTFIYDLEVIALYPGALEQLRDQCLEVLNRDTARTRWLRDLTVYEGYHENLLRCVERCLAGDFSVPDDLKDDRSVKVSYFVEDALALPQTPEATLQAILSGKLTV